jgi:hypothetical protein
MKPTRIAALVASSIFVFSTAALGQQTPATQPAAEPPTPPPGDAPPPQPSSAAPSTERKLRVASDEETTDETEVEPEVQWGIGARSRFITTPKWMIELFVEHATSMKSVSFAGEVIRRKGNFDLVISLEYENVAPEDGLYEEKDEDPREIDMYPDYYDFDSNFAFLSADISFIWHFELTDFMAFRVGPGVGLGVPINGWTNQDTTCDSSTTIDDLDDPNACTKVPGAIEEGNPPPVMPVVNLLVGLRFKIVDELSLNIEAGYRLPSFFVGGGLGYFF